MKEGAMLQVVRDIAEFHEAGEVPALDKPGFPDEGRVELRKKLIREEVGETLRAIDEGDLVEVADGIADSIVVLVGTALEFGIDLTAVWNEVHRSNMSKFPECAKCHGTGLVGVDEEHDRHCHTCDGRGTLILRREDGKILKPESWSPPNIAPLVGRS
jgi:predicted HAD superfamily Cof-like phosphohydrolase